MSVVSGSLRKLAIRRGGASGSWLDVAHVVSDSWNEQTDFAGTTTRNNNGFKSFIPISIEGSIDVTGIIFDDADIVGKIGHKELREVQRAFEKVEYRLQVVGATDVEYGTMYVRNVSDTAEVSGLYEYQASFQVTGQPVILGDDTAPTAPFLNPLLIDTQVTSISLSWSGATDDIGVTGYEVRKNQTGQPEQIIDVGNVLFWTDNGVAQGQTYSYNVRAYDAIGNVSPWSNKRLTTLPIPPDQEDVLNYILQENEELILTEDNSSLKA